MGKLGRKTRIALYVVGGLIALGITGAAIGGPREITALLRAESLAVLARATFDGRTEYADDEAAAHTTDVHQIAVRSS